MKKERCQFNYFWAIFIAILLAVFLLPISVEASDSELTIITRQQWEADPEHLEDSQGEILWPVTYQKPKKFIVHHTAGSDGGDTPQATIRAIYYYHAQVLGWGDIGYNYLIDSKGNIYEGRRGGDGAIAAHAYRDSGCNQARFGGGAEGINFNQGTIGIALLGNYEEGEPSEKAVTALKKLIAQKSADLGINPKGKSDFHDLADLPNVVGHQDVDCTLCPGVNLEDKLVSIRKLAYNLAQTISDTGASFQKVAKAKLIDQIDSPIELEPGETANIWAEYKNTGNFTWRKYFTDTIYLQSANYNQDSLLHLSAAETNYIDLETGNVEPQETGLASFTIKAPTDKLSVSETFYLVYDGEKIPGSEFTIKVEVVGLDYAANLSSQNILPASFLNSRLKITAKFINHGLTTWTKDNTYLNIYDLNDQPSVYYDASWPDREGKIIQQEEEVGTGETATFVFYQSSPNLPGLYKQIFKLFCEEEQVINSRVSLNTRVDSHFQAKLVDHDIPPAVLAAWRPQATIKFKNTGLADWDQNMRLYVYDLGFTSSQFRERNWLNHYGQFRMQEQIVEPGETATFQFTYHNANPGIYRQIFRLELLNRDIAVQNGSFNLITRVD